MESTVVLEVSLVDPSIRRLKEKIPGVLEGYAHYSKELPDAFKPVPGILLNSSKD